MILPPLYLVCASSPPVPFTPLSPVSTSLFPCCSHTAAPSSCLISLLHLACTHTHPYLTHTLIPCLCHTPHLCHAAPHLHPMPTSRPCILAMLGHVSWPCLAMHPGHDSPRPSLDLMLWGLHPGYPALSGSVDMYLVTTPTSMCHPAFHTPFWLPPSFGTGASGSI